MTRSMEGLKEEAIRKATESGKLEDIERAASICKLAAEAEKDYAEAGTKGTVVQAGLALPRPRP